MFTEPEDLFAEKALNEKYLILETQRNKGQEGRDDMRALLTIKALNLGPEGTETQRAKVHAR